MDCMEGMADFPDKFFDLCLTDPPYGVGVKYNTFDDTRENLKILINRTFNEINRVSKRIVIACGIRNMWLYPEPSWILCWYIKSGYGVNNWGFTTWHPILVYGKDPYLENGMGSRADSISHIEQSDFYKNNHPCPKPINFWRKLLLRCSVKETDKIIDPFSGSGTTALACEMENRNWIGFEIDKDYHMAATERIERHKSQLKLF